MSVTVDGKFSECIFMLESDLLLIENNLPICRNILIHFENSIFTLEIETFYTFYFMLTRTTFWNWLQIIINNIIWLRFFVWSLWRSTFYEVSWNDIIVLLTYWIHIIFIVRFPNQSWLNYDRFYDRTFRRVRFHKIFAYKISAELCI